VDVKPADVHAEDRLACASASARSLATLMPPGLAAPADQHLRLDDARVADLVGGGHRLVDVVAGEPEGTGTPWRANSCLP
jgi:hypothetical protein